MFTAEKFYFKEILLSGPNFAYPCSKPRKTGILSKSIRVQNPPDQNLPAFEINPIFFYIFFIY